MSVLIKGMEKPDNCEICPYAFCHLDTRNCPIVAIPDHGDLIDRDELLKRAVFMPRGGVNLPLMYMSYVKAAKAIIPAERGEE